MDLEKITELYSTHRGGIIGAVTGILVAVAILLLGLFKVLFIAILAGIGYYIGKRMHEDRDYIKNLLDRVLPPGTYR